VPYRIFYTEEALNEFRSILYFISADSPSAAVRFGESLLDHIDLSAELPTMGTRVTKRSRVRKLVHSPIRIYYRVNHSRRLVEILHFWHGARESRCD